MLCEHYKKTLIEAAASDVPPSEDLRSHLDGCAACRAAFEQEQALFASIDAGLRVTVNAEVPASLLPGVRARLNDQVVPRRSWVPAWMAIATVTAAALILTVVSVRNRRTNEPEKNRQDSAIARTFPPAEDPGIRNDPPFQRYPARGINRRSQPRGRVRSASGQQVSVLVPAGQRQVMDAFLASLQQGAVKPEFLIAGNPEQRLQDLRVLPLDIPPLEVKPLAGVSGDATWEGENERR